MPHEKKYKYTKEGYIIKIEDKLNKSLPLSWWRLRIGRAAALWELLESGDLKKFIKLSKKYKLKIPE
jgi:hypothetical protein